MSSMGHCRFSPFFCFFLTLSSWAHPVESPFLDRFRDAFLLFSFRLAEFFYQACSAVPFLGL